MIRTEKRIWLCGILTILNILFIWGNSLLTREVSASISKFVGKILSFIFSDCSGAAEGTGHGILRKIAHATEFCSLGILLSWGVRMLGKRKWELYIFPAMMGITVAAIDETIQIFVPGRGPHIRDVGIDTAGVVLGIVIFTLIFLLHRKKKESAEGVYSVGNKKSPKMTAKQRQEQAAKQQKKEMVIIACIAVVVAIAVAVALLISMREPGKEGYGATLETAKVTHVATIEIEGRGTIKAELYGQTAPVSVNNFVELAESGFYDGLTFHRIINGFMMQGGAGNDDSPAVEPIHGEFSENGFENNLLHKKGVLSMARVDDMNSATSQFFILHEDHPSLNGKYAAFGRVIEGQDIVDEICEEFPSSENTIPLENQPVIKSITIEKK